MNCGSGLRRIGKNSPLHHLVYSAGTIHYVPIGPDFRRPAVADSIEPAYYSEDLIWRTRVTLVPSAGPIVVVLVIPNLASQN